MPIGPGPPRQNIGTYIVDHAAPDFSPTRVPPQNAARSPTPTKLPDNAAPDPDPGPRADPNGVCLWPLVPGSSLRSVRGGNEGCVGSLP